MENAELKQRQRALEEQLEKTNQDNEKAVNEMLADFEIRERGMLASIDKLDNKNKFLL